MKKWIDLFERALKVGTVLNNRYEIVRLLGKGGYGLVYEALDNSLGQKVVVKQLRKRRAKSQKDCLAFENEAAILKSLSHPAFPSYIDSFQDQTGKFIVMEKLDGYSFEELIFQQKKEFDHDDSLLILLEVLKLVHFLHCQGIIHRDLRIPNILMNNDQLLIIDFGLARRIGDRDDFNEKNFKHVARCSFSFQEDLMALGHFVLFLLYSTYKPVSIREKSWEEELKLPRKTKEVIRKMLHISPPYDSVEQVIEDVQNILFSSPNQREIKPIIVAQNG